MSFSPFLTAGGGVAASDGLAFDGLAVGGARPAPWRRLERFVGERSELDRVGLAQTEARARLKIDSRVAGPREVDARELRDRRPSRRNRSASKRRRFELVAGVQRAQLEIAARVGLKGVDQLARRIELEVAVGVGRGNLGRRAQKRADLAPKSRSSSPEPMTP